MNNEGTFIEIDGKGPYAFSGINARLPFGRMLTIGHYRGDGHRGLIAHLGRITKEMHIPPPTSGEPTTVEYIHIMDNAEIAPGLHGKRRIVGVGNNAKDAMADAKRQMDAIT